jgi:hypothetical protein
MMVNICQYFKPKNRSFHENSNIHEYANELIHITLQIEEQFTVIRVIY